MNSGGRECISTGHTKQGIVYVGPSLHHNLEPVDRSKHKKQSCKSHHQEDPQVGVVGFRLLEA